MSLRNNPFVCNNVEETYKIINLNADVANSLTPEDILYHIGETFKIERAKSGVLIK